MANVLSAIPAPVLSMISKTLKKELAKSNVDHIMLFFGDGEGSVNGFKAELYSGNPIAEMKAEIEALRAERNALRSELINAVSELEKK